jgi:hypothetical protein
MKSIDLKSGSVLSGVGLILHAASMVLATYTSKTPDWAGVLNIAIPEALAGIAVIRLRWAIKNK